jgi:ADP-ribose pyrophosphatase
MPSPGSSAVRPDKPEHWPIQSHAVLAKGVFAAFNEDAITTPGGETLRRQYLTHPGSVAIIALDESDRVAVVNQYRHSVAMVLTEPPAGLLDHGAEDPLAAAKRELAEEARLQAATWRVLVDFYASPGISQETSRIYLATDLSPAPLPEGFTVEGEEAYMGLSWVPLADLLAGIRAGRLQNPALILGCLAVHTARLDGSLDSLRPGDAPWPARANKERQDARIAA